MKGVTKILYIFAENETDKTLVFTNEWQVSWRCQAQLAPVSVPTSSFHILSGMPAWFLPLLPCRSFLEAYLCHAIIASLLHSGLKHAIYAFFYSTANDLKRSDLTNKLTLKRLAAFSNRGVARSHSADKRKDKMDGFESFVASLYSLLASLFGSIFLSTTKTMYWC